MLHITKNTHERQLGLGFESPETKPVVDQQPAKQLCSSLVIDQLPGTHPAVTKSLDAALQLQDAFAGDKSGGRQWSMLQLHGTYMVIQQCTYTRLALDGYVCIPSPWDVWVSESA